MVLTKSGKMLKVTLTLAIFTFFCLVDRHNVNAAVRSVQKSHNYPQKEVIYNGYSFKEGNLVYAVCENIAKGKKCTIMQERYPDGKSPRSCDISLDIQQENGKLSDQIYLAAFGQDNVVLFWDEIGPTTNFKLLIVKMDNCQTGSFVLSDPSEQIYEDLLYNNKIVTYDDKLEIFIKNSNLSNGADDVETVIIVNSNGIVEKNPTEFMKTGKSSVTFISPIDKASPNKDYVYSKDVDGKHVFTIRKADGSEKVITSFDDNVYVYHSLVNNFITLCMNSSVSCTQYDKEGNLKFNTAIDDIESKDRVATRDLYNLPGGGFLMAFTQYAKSNDKVDFSTVSDYHIIKVSGDGKKVDSIRLSELIDADNAAKVVVSTYVWKNGNDEYCAAVLGQGINQKNPEDDPSDLNVLVNCFKDADLVAFSF